MDIKLVLFDLDGTLLPMNQDEFTKGYFKLLINKLSPYGYDSEKLVESIWRRIYADTIQTRNIIGKLQTGLMQSRKKP